jgi:hypothetical protein
MGKKRLGDLYRTWRMVECTDDSGEKIAVSLAKINRPDTDAAVQAANAARARILIRRHQPESELWLECYGEIADQERSELTDFLISDEMAQRHLSAEAEEAAREEWTDDEYLEGLRTLWTDELNMTWATNPEDPDARRVYDELSRFKANVEKRLEGEDADLAEKYSHLDDEELRRKVVTKLIENTSNVEWLAEFEFQRIFYSTREPLDRSKRYFTKLEEVRDLDDRIYGQLRREYDQLSIDVISGKGSQATQGSSPPSEPSAEEAPSTPSGHETSPLSRTSPTSS